MATERGKMLRGEMANTTDPSLQESFRRTKGLLKRLNALSFYDAEYRKVLEELLPTIPKSSTIMSPFHSDQNNIKIGENVFINAGCIFLDGGGIEIGDYTLIGPAVQIYTPQHPHDHIERRQPVEWAERVVIGRDCWIGGGAIICPGVEIGDRVIVGAGSVVVNDVPSDTTVVGNPARVIKTNKPK